MKEKKKANWMSERIMEMSKKRSEAKAKQDKNLRKEFNKKFQRIVKETRSGILTTYVKTLKMETDMETRKGLKKMSKLRRRNSNQLC